MQHHKVDGNHTPSKDGAKRSPDVSRGQRRTCAPVAKASLASEWERLEQTRDSVVERGVPVAPTPRGEVEEVPGRTEQVDAALVAVLAQAR